MEWPSRWGGADATSSQILAVKRVLRAAGAPLPLTDVAINMVGPAIMAFGTPEQQQRHLPGIADGSVVWTQLFSEPNAGSDLATLRLRATAQGDGSWVLSGQKVWNTYAHVAQWGYLLARTGGVDERHRGLTMFLVPMDAPGVSIVPIREITGSADFNEVFFDDVRVPAGAVLGEVGKGWSVSMSTLADERAVVGGFVLSLEAESRRLASVLLELGAHATPFLPRLTEISAHTAALAAAIQDDGVPAGMESLGKVEFSEINIALHQLALDVIAANPDGVPDGWQQRWADNYLYTRAYTISGGANEVLRGVMAKRGMELGRV
jgi:alkylation response protein AidB-like acyl-CoA dehydrogenase